ncbi:hypothetical protein QTP88_028537 [Uroleucon formosanum]
MCIKHTILVIIITIIPFTYVFIAYDCDGPAQNITSFDSLEVDNCDFPIASKTQQVPRIQLLQRIETYPVHFKSCFISLDYLITRCSIFEDAQLVEGGYFSEVVDLGNARCSETHQKRSYTFPRGVIVTDLQMNETTLISHTVMAGSLDRFGNCRGTNFKSSRRECKDNTLILPSGTKMKLSDNYGMTRLKAKPYGQNGHFNCEEQDFVVLFDGPASLINSITNNNSSIHTYIVETDKIVFALKQINKTFACEIPVIQSEHTQLLILIDTTFFNNFQIKSISPQNTNLIAYKEKPKQQEGNNDSVQWKIDEDTITNTKKGVGQLDTIDKEKPKQQKDNNDSRKRNIDEDTIRISKKGVGQLKTIDDNVTSRCIISKPDIGSFIGKTNVNDFIKKAILEDHWYPPENYEGCPKSNAQRALAVLQCDIIS